VYSTGEKLQKYRGIYTLKVDLDELDKMGKHNVSHLSIPKRGDRRVTL
jgi:hypothetical protein